jgi:hypothetical protein
MTDSWEFAVTQAEGEYITLLGDDDGLLLHALPEIDRLLRLLNAHALRWESVCYHWPDLPRSVHAAPHETLIPLKQSGSFHPIYLRAATDVIPEAANCRLSYSELPMIYCSVVHRDLLDRLRARCGRVFRSRSPDVYSSFALAAVAGTYHSVTAPMSINALSGRSNGVANVYLNGKSPIAEEYHALNRSANHGPHPAAPDVLVMAAAIADSFLHAKEALFPDDPALALDRRQLVRNCVQQLRVGDDASWKAALQALRRSVRDDAALLDWFDAEYGRRDFEPATQAQPATQWRRYGGTYLHLRAADFGVSDVYGVAQLCETLLGYQRDGVNAHLVPSPRAA